MDTQASFTCSVYNVENIDERTFILVQRWKLLLGNMYFFELKTNKKALKTLGIVF